MPISGYDPDDLDDALRNIMSRRDPEEFLTEEQHERWESGEDLVELFDEDDLERLFKQADVDVE